MNTLSKLGGFVATAALLTTLATAARADDRASPSPDLATPGSHSVAVVLHADAPGATIERRASVRSFSGLPIEEASIAGVATWVAECTAPCETRLDTKYTYRVAGDGLVPSGSFTLPPEGPVVVDAEVGSATGRLGGLGIGALGAGGLVLGVAALAVTPILAEDNVGTPEVRTGVLAGGIAVTALGALAFSAGVWLWSHNDTTIHSHQPRGFEF